MNAAAKIINQGNLFNGQWAQMHMSRSIYLIVFLLLTVLLSALAIVYSTNAYRSTFNRVEQEEQQTLFLQLQWGKLLLEQASLATPERVETLAREQLSMVIPNAKDVYRLHPQ